MFQTLVSGLIFAACFALAASVVIVVYTAIRKKESPIAAARDLEHTFVAGVEHGAHALVSEFRGLEAGVLTEIQELEDKAKLDAGTVKAVVEKFFGVQVDPLDQLKATANRVDQLVTRSEAVANTPAPATAPAPQTLTLTITGPAEQITAAAEKLQTAAAADGVNIIHAQA